MVIKTHSNKSNGSVFIQTI